MSVLRTTAIGRAATAGGKRLYPALSNNGCKGCAFEAESGAAFCRYRADCFADQRPDRMTVKFIEVEK